jgi:hypothetical protein
MLASIRGLSSGRRSQVNTLCMAYFSRHLTWLVSMAVSSLGVRIAALTSLR